MKCVKCGEDVVQKSKGIQIGKKFLCSACASKLETESPCCPFCGTVDKDGESVALLLTRANATPAERVSAHTALVNVCPKCHGLYFDNFQFELLRMLKND